MMIKILAKIIVLITLVTACGPARVGVPPTTTALPEPVLTPAPLQPEIAASQIIISTSNPYLGQKVPGLTPEIFAPRIVSDPNFKEYSGTFSPDGNEYYFYRFSNDMPSKILFSKVINGIWTIPEQLPVTAGYDAYEPHLTFDNNRLFFAWDRPVPKDHPAYPASGGIYVADRTPSGWSEPQYTGQGMFLSSSRDGQLYITDMSSRATALAKVTVENGLFTKYEKLPVKAPFGYPAHPCIAPDGSFLLFDVKEGNYLFASFKKADGTWSDPVDLTKHSFDQLAGGATVSPDGKYLFFALRGDIWWVDIQVIENLRPNE